MKLRFVGLALLLLVVVVSVPALLEVRAFERSAREFIDRAARVRAGASPSYQVETLAALEPNALNGDYYRLDEWFDLESGSTVADQTAEQAADAPGLGIVFAMEFDAPERAGLDSRAGRTSIRMVDGRLLVKQSGSDPLVNTVPLSIPKDPVGEIRIRLRADAGTRMTLAWSKDEAPESLWKNQISIDLIPDSLFHTYVISAGRILERGLNPGDSIRTLALRASNADGAEVELDFIRFVSKQAKYLYRKRGTEYETLGGEYRPVIYLVPDRSLAFPVQVPATDPVFEFGTGVLLEGNPVRFEVTITDDGVTRTIYDEFAGEPSWKDVRLDLSEWAGRPVEITLRVRGSRSNVAFWSSPIVRSPPPKRFNVVIVLEDALRADRLSTYGYASPTSPVKDSLMGAGGVVFLNAISQATRTRPSVPSMMTSLLPSATGVWNWDDALADEYLTLAEVLRSQGFVTASFIQNENAGPLAGLHQGFDVVRTRTTIDATTEALLARESLDWLARHRDQNFFLYLHVVDPHGPYDPPSPFDGEYREAGAGTTPVERADDLDPAWEERPTAEGRSRLYDGEVRHNDSVLETFLDGLRTLGLADNTLLVFLADHGEFLGEHGLWDHDPPGLRQVIHVPLMLYHPTLFPDAARIPQTVQLIDVMPTILELAGVPMENMLFEGSSLVDLIEGRRLSDWENRLVISEEPTAMSKGQPCECGSLFFRNWHLLVSNGLADLPGRHLFSYRRVFDVRRDAAETDARFSLVPNLLVKTRFASVVRQIQTHNIEASRSWRSREDDSYALDPDAVERLRSLGYIN